MTAPAREGSPTKTRVRDRSAAHQADTATKAATDTVEAPPTPTTPETGRPRRTRSAAAERAYARRAQREAGKRPRVRDAVSEARPRRSEPRRQPVARKQTSTASFVVLIITLLLIGVGVTLWLSTQAIADSYRLDNAKKGVADLSEQAERLRREVTSMDSASALDRRARALGMVPAGDPAHLVVDEHGRVHVIGDPTQATKPAPPPSTPSSTANGNQNRQGQGNQGQENQHGQQQTSPQQHGTG